MPGKKTNNPLAAKFDKAVAEHANDETELSLFTNLPGGIPNGIAQLSSVSFSQYKRGDQEGEWFLRLAGIVQEPELAANGDHVKGLQTSQMIPLCDTTTQGGKTTTLDEHVETMMTHFRSLGYNEPFKWDGREAIAAALVEAAPYFRFSTSQSEPTEQYPNPRVWENWGGGKGLENYEANGASSQVVDQSEQVDDSDSVSVDTTAEAPDDTSVEDLVTEAENGDETSQQTLKDRAMAAGNTEKAVDDADDWASVAAMIGEESDSSDSSNNESEDLTALGVAADNGDEDAQSKITAAAEAAGIEDTFEDWAGWAAAISEAGSEATAEPEKGETYFFKPKGAKKSVECQVTAVFPGKKTCNLKNLVSNKVIKAVSWDSLEQGS